MKNIYLNIIATLILALLGVVSYFGKGALDTQGELVKNQAATEKNIVLVQAKMNAMSKKMSLFEYADDLVDQGILTKEKAKELMAIMDEDEDWEAIE